MMRGKNRQDCLPPVPPSPNALSALIQDVSGRYAAASRYTQGYVRSKLRWDPATAAILELAAKQPFGHVVDLGCGRGQLALALLVSCGAQRVTGLDSDAPRLREARHAAKGLPARFDLTDLTVASIPEGNTILLVDVLYQLPLRAQFRLLESAAAAARQRLVIRTFDPHLGWRSRVGYAAEVVNRALRRDQGASIQPMPLPQLSARLAAQGFQVTVHPCWAGTPLPNVLVVAERTGA